MIGVDTATEIKAFRVGPGRGGPAAEPFPKEGERKTCRWFRVSILSRKGKGLTSPHPAALRAARTRLSSAGRPTSSL
jgi:hypothetical protein